MKFGANLIWVYRGMKFAVSNFEVSVGRAARNKSTFGEESGVMDDAKLEGEVNDLVKQFGGTGNPQFKKLAMLAKQASDSHEQLKESVDSLQESLDYLRICIKYQLFDLEATRRENRYLRKLLEENNG